MQTTQVQLTLDMLASFKAEDIAQAYSGKDGKCCCGCSGEYWKNPGNGPHEAGLKNPMRQIARVLKIVQCAPADKIEIGANNIAMVIGSRVYIVYPKCAE